jgi:hypothetical protein
VKKVQRLLKELKLRVEKKRERKRLRSNFSKKEELKPRRMAGFLNS